MIFKRRERRSWGEWLRDLVRPRKGWKRGVKYIGRRVQRLPDTPHRIALGFACGAAASFTPFFTLHALVAIVLAWAVRGNIIAGVFGTAVGNPISFPLIAATCMQTGYWILGLSGDTAAATEKKLSFSYMMAHPIDFLVSIFTPYLIGGLLPGLLCGVAFYVVLRPIVASFQDRRRKVLARRAKELVVQHRGAGRKHAEAGDDDHAPEPAPAVANGAATAAAAAARRAHGVIERAGGDPKGPRPAQPAD